MELESMAIRIARNENLPVLPQVARFMLERTNDPNLSAREIEKVVEKDPAIAAKVIKAASSAQFGGNSLTSIGAAITILGLQQLKQIVMSASFQAMLSNGQPAGEFNPMEYWRHSIAVGAGAKIMGRLKGLKNVEELYMAGMLHDVGMLVMVRFLPAKFDLILAQAISENRPIHEVEQEILGWDHTQVGDLLAQKWGLSPVIRAAIRFHHQPLFDEDQPTTTAMIAVANDLSHTVGFLNNAPTCAYEVCGSALEEIGIPAAQLPTVGEVMVNEVTKAETVLGLSQLGIAA